MTHPVPLPDIPTARRWWAKHRDRVQQSLPLTVGCRTFTRAYGDRVSGRLERADSWPLALAEAEILRDLRTVRNAIAAKAKKIP